MFIDILIFIIIILSMINTMACFINPSLNTNMSLVWGQTPEAMAISEAAPALGKFSAQEEKQSSVVIEGNKGQWRIVNRTGRRSHVTYAGGIWRSFMWSTFIESFPTRHCYIPNILSLCYKNPESHLYYFLHPTYKVQTSLFAFFTQYLIDSFYIPDAYLKSFMYVFKSYMNFKDYF